MFLYTVTALNSPRSSRSMRRRMKAAVQLRTALLCAMPLFLSVSACSLFEPRPITQGSLIEKPDYDQLKVGETTKEDTLKILGSPTTHATFNDNTWLYIQLVTKPVPLSFPSTDAQDVVVANFDNQGILQDLHHYNKNQALHVHMNGSHTPSPGTNISVMEELLGSMGRYNPLAGMASSFGGMGGMSTPGSGGMGGMGMGGMGANGSGTGYGGTGNSLN